jgi:thioredoxin
MIELIDFFATWCGPCRIMSPIVDELERSFQGKVSFKKVDVDQDSSTAQKYNVMSIPTFVLEKNGTEVSRKNGAFSKQDMEAWIRYFLNE